MSARNQTARRGAVDLQGGFDGTGEGHGISDGAVARHAPGEARCTADIGASHVSLDALVDIAQPFLETDHGLAVGREPEMARFDDAGMHGTDGDFVQALALGRQELVRASLGRTLSLAERMAQAPSPMVEPRPAARAFRPPAVRTGPGWLLRDGEPVDGCGRPRGIVRSGQSRLTTPISPDGSLRERHVNFRAFAPESEQRPARRAEKTDCGAPGFRRHDGARPRMMIRHRVPRSHQFGDLVISRIVYPNCRATC